MKRWQSVIMTLGAAFLGAAAGLQFGLSSFANWTSPDGPDAHEYQVELPHHVPKYQGGAAFRFAMVQDVIHERFAKHGPAYYQERDRLTRENLAKLAPDDPARFPLLDDLGVGLDRLGKSDEAVAVLREKLKLQEAKGLGGRDLYTSYANLGTFLIHGSFKRMAGGDNAARERFLEGVKLVEKSVEVNPEAHFGREQWQAAIAEFLLAAMDTPELLKKFDCLGNRLDTPQDGQGRAYGSSFGDGRLWGDLYFESGSKPDDPKIWAKFVTMRDHITKVGAEAGWSYLPVPSHRQPVPFDEPVMGIIGMWRQGGGANPHFALALGETMLRVGQRYLAWSCFERASRLAERYSADPELQGFLRKHCSKRQREIEKLARKNQDDLRSDFDRELAYGDGYQRSYQAFESNKIRNGVSIYDLRFWDDFPRKDEHIASPSGPEELYAAQSTTNLITSKFKNAVAWAIFGAGAAALGMSWLLTRKRRRHQA